jgi:hypothetical protein
MEPVRQFELHRKAFKFVELPMRGGRLPVNALLETSTKVSLERENSELGMPPVKLLASM